MAEFIIQGSTLEAIGDAIRSKTGGKAKIPPEDMAQEIRDLESGSGETIIVDGVDPYYQQLAETLMLRDATLLSADATTLTLKGFKKKDGTTLGNLPSYSFAGFNKVVNMEFSDVLLVNDNAFYNCSKLEILDVTTGATVDLFGIAEQALTGCSELKAIIVRDGGGGIKYTNVNLANGANDTFYVYVPAEHYDTIVSNISSNNISSSRYRKIEDYPEITNWNQTFQVKFYDGDTLLETKTVRNGQNASYTYQKEGKTFLGWNPQPVNVTSDMKCYGSWATTKFEDASWEEINSLATDGQISKVYKIGDSKPVTLTYDDGTSETINFRIVDMNVDVQEDGTTAPITMMADNIVKTSTKLASSSSNQTNNFYGCDTISQFLETIFNALPADLQNVIKTVQKYNLMDWVKFNHKIFVPSKLNLDGVANASSYFIPKLQYKHFVNGNSYGRTKCSDNATDDFWVSELRTTVSGTNYYYWVDAGKVYTGNGHPINETHGIVPCFCI